VPVCSLPDWIAEFACPNNVWYVKRLSGNDTLANKSHQAGPYIPKDLLFSVLPALNDRSTLNPRVKLPAFVDSHPEVRDVTPIWYNGKLFGKTRNEARVTGWGGMNSALLDPDSTGALAAFVFVDGATDAGASSLHIWVCEGYQDEVIEDQVGPVEPGRSVTWIPGTPVDLLTPKAALSSCRLSASQLPAAWLERFPSPTEIVRKSVELRPLQSEPPDARLVRRRDCEFELFKSVEDATETPRIAQGFASLDEFVSLALSILQRRKSRSGRSLELHTREIFLEEGLLENLDFSHSPMSEGEKRPDFLFPSEAAYRDPDFPSSKLRMLGAKTTLKDRWRQVLNEADRIPQKHLLTLQEGVSENQFAEMRAAGVQLVVPTSLVESFPKAVREHLITLEQFIAEVRLLGTTH
jgi:hypothetical protein